MGKTLFESWADWDTISFMGWIKFVLRGSTVFGKKPILFICWLQQSFWYDMAWSKTYKKNLNIIRNIYDNVTSCVMFNQETSDTSIFNAVLRHGNKYDSCFLFFNVNDFNWIY